MPELTVLQRLRLVMQDIEDSKRAVLCSPEDHAALEAALRVLRPGPAELMTLKPSRLVPVGTVYVVDENAMEAGLRQSLQRELRKGLFLHG